MHQENKQIIISMMIKDLLQCPTHPFVGIILIVVSKYFTQVSGASSL